MHDEIAEAFIEHSQKIEQQQLLLSNILVDLDQAQQAALLIELTYKILNQTKRSHLVPNPALVAKHLQARASYGRWLPIVRLKEIRYYADKAKFRVATKWLKHYLSGFFLCIY